MAFAAPHVILLGDSIFDNGAYVSGGPDVVHQLRDRLPRNGRATLLAVDGTTTSEVLLQLQRAPSDASHLVVSVGGNDPHSEITKFSRRELTRSAML